MRDERDNLQPATTAYHGAGRDEVVRGERTMVGRKRARVLITHLGDATIRPPQWMCLSLRGGRAKEKPCVHCGEPIAPGEEYILEKEDHGFYCARCFAYDMHVEE